MIEYVLFIVGIALLIKSADFLVDGASSLADKLGIPTLIIGLTIVAFGTSMPELIVNIFAALEGTTDIAFGNIIGSSLANILLILGLVAIILPIRIQHSTVWKEIPFALLAAVVLFIVANDFVIDKIEIFSLTRIDGIIMLLFFAIFLYYVFETAKANRVNLEDKKIKVKKYKNSVIALLIIVGLIGLTLGGKWTVDGAVFIAQQFGLSQFLISATIIAIGTSLPELMTSFAAIRKKDVDLAVGNIVGSNIFNIFWILGVTAFIAPVAIPNFVNFDMILLIFVTVALFFFMFIGKKHHLDRWQGILFVLLYIAYIIFIIIRG